LTLRTELGTQKSERKHKMVQANPRPTNPPISHEDRLAADWINRQGTTSHYNTFLSQAFHQTTSVRD
jgi:hypothetical protein